VADVDGYVGQILAAAPEATVVLVGDHGESLGEHGYLFNHGKLAFSPDTHVPLLLSGPQITPAVRDELVDTTDVAATLLALAGQPTPSEMTARSLLSPQQPRPQLSVTISEGDADPILGSFSSVVMRQEDRSLGGSREHPIAAYRRAGDAREQVPLPVEADDELRLPVEAVLSSGVSPIESSAEMEEALRALGYLE
jgi:arylsulfatase A-like enzyme